MGSPSRPLVEAHAWRDVRKVSSGVAVAAGIRRTNGLAKEVAQKLNSAVVASARTSCIPPAPRAKRGLRAAVQGVAATASNRRPDKNHLHAKGHGPHPVRRAASSADKRGLRKRLRAGAGQLRQTRCSAAWPLGHPCKGCPRQVPQRGHGPRGQLQERRGGYVSLSRLSCSAQRRGSAARPSVSGSSCLGRSLVRPASWLPSELRQLTRRAGTAERPRSAHRLQTDQILSAQALKVRVRKTNQQPCYASGIGANKSQIENWGEWRKMAMLSRHIPVTKARYVREVPYSMPRTGLQNRAMLQGIAMGSPPSVAQDAQPAIEARRAWWRNCAESLDARDHQLASANGLCLGWTSRRLRSAAWKGACRRHRC